MPAYTPFLALRKDYLTDYSNILALHPNWDKLDKWLSDFNDHDHDFSEIWEAIYYNRKLIFELDRRLTKTEIFISQFYEEFLRHNHDGVETLWREFFDNFEQTDLENSTAVVTPERGLLHLPDNYRNNQRYLWVGRPFELNLDPYPDNLARVTDPENVPTRAFGKIVASRKGEIQPFLAVSNNPRKGSGRGYYAGAKPGTLLSKSLTKEYIVSTHSFDGKDLSTDNDTSRAYHYIGSDYPVLARYNPKWQYNVPFSQADYNKIQLRDGKEVQTKQSTDRKAATYEQVSANVQPRILYNDDIPLCWDRSSNTFYWLNQHNGRYTRIRNNDLGPIYDENITEVAANRDPVTNNIYILVSTTEEANRAGYFHVFHQMFAWDGANYFEQGQRWRSASLKKYHWPRPYVLVPTQLAFLKGRIALITELSPRDRIIYGKKLVNYYRDQPNYQWFPFRKYYADVYQRASYADFVLFNPGMLATVLTVNKGGDMTTTGTAGVVMGNYHPTNNRWSTCSDQTISEFEGANDKLYMGNWGDDLIFYQAFIPYDGVKVLRRGDHEDSQYRLKNFQSDWHGFVRYGMSSGISSTRSTNMPRKVNAAAGLNARDAYVMGGTELVKQWVMRDGRRIATKNNAKPSGDVIYGFWMDRKASGAKTAENLPVDAIDSRPIKALPYYTGQYSNQEDWSRIPTFVKGGVTNGVQSPQMTANSSGFCLVGGRVIRGRQALRPRPSDVFYRGVTIFEEGLEDGTHAHQLFHIPKGINQENDEIRIYYKGRAEGQAPANPGNATIRDQDIMIYVYGHSGLGGDWIPVAGQNRPALPATITDQRVLDNENMYILVKNLKKTHAATNKPSELYTDHIQVEVARRSYVYEYEWDDLPKESHAAMVIECRGGGDQLGVEVESSELNLISSYGG